MRYHRRHGWPLGWWVAAALLPLAAVIALRLSPLDQPAPIPHRHFYIVTITAAVSFALALLTGRTALQTRDFRLLGLALGFLSVSGIFAVHGAATPGVFLHKPALEGTGLGTDYGTDYGAPGHGGSIVGLSAFLSLWFGSAFFFLSRSPLPELLRRKAGLSPWIPLTVWLVALLAYGVGAFAFQEFFEALPLSGPWPSWVVGGTAMLFLLLAAWSFLQGYSLTRLPMQAALGLGMLLLFDAQLAMLISPAWTPSWWSYHILMLGGFTIGVAGLLGEYEKGRGLRRIMEGVFNLESVVQLELTYAESVAALAAATEAKDPQTKGHTVRVAELAAILGKALRLPNDRLRVLARAGLLHDVGKLGIPDSILLKPGKLTPEEFATMQLHSTLGFDITRRLPSMKDEAWLIRHHHERVDSQGYPDKIAAGTLPLEARALSVADVYDSLRSDRPYRKGYDPATALSILRQEASNGHLDPQVVATFVELIESGQVELVYQPAPGTPAAQPARGAAP